MLGDFRPDHANWPLLISLAVLLNACGSSDPVTGTFIDSPVAGLRYQTRTQEGVTNADGEFRYRDGEQVSFYLGNLPLGTADGAPQLSPFDLVPGSEPLIGTALRVAWHTDEKLAEVSRIATLLQSFDRDQNPTNGIDIPAEVAALFVTGEEDFRKIVRLTNEKQLLDVPAGVPSRRYALQALYAGLGINSKLKAPVIERWDDDADGDIDSVSAIEYDSQGNRVSRVDETFAETNREAYVFYRNTQFDRLGRLQREDDYDSRWPDNVYSHLVEFDELGLLVRVASSETLAETETVTYEQFYFYDESLEFVRQDTYSLDYYGEKYLNRSSLRSISGDTQTDTGTNYALDGSVTSVTTRTKTQSGNKTVYTDDYESDGDFESVRTHTFNEEGLPISVEEVSKTYIGTRATFLFTYEYDLRGNLSRFIADFERDGLNDNMIEYFYDADGNLLRTEHSDGRGNATSTIHYEYDDRELWWCLEQGCSYLQF